MSVPTVRIYDFGTQQVRVIPAAELAPGYVKIRIEDREGEFWAEARGVQASAIRHARLSTEVKARILRLKEQLGDAHPLSLEEWEVGFQRDAHPEREIAVWESIASAYERLARGRQLSLDKRRATVACLTMASINGTERPTTTFSSPFLTRDEVRMIADEYARPTGSP